MLQIKSLSALSNDYTQAKGLIQSYAKAERISHDDWPLKRKRNHPLFAFYDKTGFCGCACLLCSADAAYGLCLFQDHSSEIGEASIVELLGEILQNNRLVIDVWRPRDVSS